MFQRAQLIHEQEQHQMVSLYIINFRYSRSKRKCFNHQIHISTTKVSQPKSSQNNKEIKRKHKTQLFIENQQIVCLESQITIAMTSFAQKGSRQNLSQSEEGGEGSMRSTDFERFEMRSESSVHGAQLREYLIGNLSFTQRGS